VAMKKFVSKLVSFFSVSYVTSARHSFIYHPVDSQWTISGTAYQRRNSVHRNRIKQRNSSTCTFYIAVLATDIFKNHMLITAVIKEKYQA
jgi:hypothetical protein